MLTGHEAQYVLGEIAHSLPAMERRACACTVCASWWRRGSVCVWIPLWLGSAHVATSLLPIYFLIFRLFVSSCLRVRVTSVGGQRETLMMVFNCFQWLVYCNKLVINICPAVLPCVVVKFWREKTVRIYMYICLQRVKFSLPGLPETHNGRHC